MKLKAPDVSRLWKSRRGRIICISCSAAICFLLGWWLGLLHEVMTILARWSTRSASMAPNLHKHIPVPVIILLVLLVEGLVLLSFVVTWRRKTDASRQQKLTGRVLLLAGIPLLMIGVVFHVDGRLSQMLLTPTVPFPGWEAVLFIVGTALAIHGAFWVRMVRWHKMYKTIDYLWYAGATIALVIAAGTLYRGQEVTYFQATIVDYHLAWISTEWN